MSIFFGALLLKLLYDCLKTKGLTVNTIFKKLLFIYLAVSISVYNGYAVKLGSVSVGINTALRYVLFAMALFLLFKKKSHFRILKLSALLWGSVLLGVIGCMVNPYRGYVIQDIARWDWVVTGDQTLEHITGLSPMLFNMLLGVLQFTIVLSEADGRITRDEVRKGVDILCNRVLPIILGYGVLELMFKKIAHINLSKYVLPFLFGNTGEIGAADRLQGFAKEPAQYAMILFIYSIIVLIEYRYEISEHGQKSKQTRNFWMRIGMIYLLMAISGSLIAYYLILVSIGCIMIYSGADIKFLVMVIIVGVVALVLVFGVPDAIMRRLDRVVLVFDALKKGQIYHSYETSEGARLMSIYYALAGLIARPLFGIGLGEIDAHTMFFSILANFGLVGSYLYFKIWYIFGNMHSRQEKASFIIIIASTFLFGGIGYFMELYFPFLLLAMSGKGARK